MRLVELVADALGRSGVPEGVEVSGIAQRHDRVAPGSLFVARRGARFDAHTVLADAVARGAVAVVGEADLPARLPWGDVPYLRVPDARAATALLAASFFGHPSERLRVVGVTGTDGKTTTSFLLHHVLGAATARPVGLVSTAGILAGGRPVPLEGHFTTPEATEIQALLARFRDAGVRDVVLESSSHGFALHRLDGVRYVLGVWTNLSPEHLDFHGTLDAYREAKLTLVRRAGVSVLNRDEPDFGAFAAAAQRHVAYGETPGSDLRIVDVAEAPGRLGITFERTVGGRLERARAELPMIGRYNAHNAAAAVQAACELGTELSAAAAPLSTFAGVPGRMQVVQAHPFTVVVDFAHTAPALAKALAAARPPAPGRLIVVIGAAGERDPGKRAPLGRAAADGADRVFLTEEDSRSESVESILDRMYEGALGAGAAERVRRVPDRREAIRRAIATATAGDVVLLAGKGHERTLERADEVVAWDEVSEARRWL